ncbi:MAG TPA: hypothetical protein VJT49_23715 [Amycolatopsis sp.]|uniref:hypothetical protein n=1 Tax=Amycolatopsis sp. TaxID=37632 RepID=UPI002B4A1C7A|nr:hypothetical protein [Amycolatopsis sp.]HKS48062.1 hypothetical protein [Amycolatopsis sp.]
MIPELFKGLLDDAAVFPPGLMPLPEAVAAHERHLASPYADIIGPLVLAAPALAELGSVEFALAVTAPAGPTQLPEVFARAGNRLAALEIAVPEGMSLAEFFTAVGGLEAPVFVEIPRDERRAEVIETCVKTGHHAKFRTGGVTSGMFPEEAELAAAIGATVRAGVAFKATAGLHHAIRNTDPVTGFEQHGYLNVLVATEAALAGAGDAELAAVLANRDAAEIAARTSTVDPATREWFRSFGTCSIVEPLTELAGLGLVPAAVAAGEGVTA